MSKKSKNTTRKQSPKSKIKKVRPGVTPKKKKTTVPAATEKEPVFIDPSSSKDPMLRRIFWIAAFAILIALALLSIGSGINGDDEFQVDYSNKLVQYYTTWGADTSALYVEKGNMHYYGGFFDLVTGLTNYALGFNEFDAAYHNVRHIYNAIFGWLAMLFIGLLVSRVGGWRAGILALLFMFFSPRFMGHSLMNPKDIPFAAGFAIALYYLVLLMRQLPQIKWQTLLGLSLGLALAFATRAGGLLLIGYLGLFLGLDFLLKYGFKGIFDQTRYLGAYVLSGLIIALAGYFLAILSWPAALVDPIGHPLKALSEFSALGIKIRLLLGGENIMSDNTAWYYPVIWMLYTIPLFALLGFFGSLAMGKILIKRYSVQVFGLLVFATLFPVLYIIYKDSILHDGWRHLMFVYPSMIALAALFWITVEDKLKPNKIGSYALIAIIVLSVAEPLLFIVRNPAYPYVYFNPMAGGISHAFGRYETDYWGTSVKQAIDWMEKEGVLSEQMQDTVTIGTSFYFNVSRMTSDKYNGKVKTKYVRFNQRYSEDWDYGIFPSRFIRGPHLRSRNWPNDKTVHVVRANGVPLTAVEKNETRNAYLGQQAIKNKNWNKAAEYLKEEAEQYPKNERAWIGLANAYLNLSDFPAATEAAKQALNVAPENENGLNFLGLATLQGGDQQAAIEAFQKLTEVNRSYFAPYYYLGLIYQQRQQYNVALDYAEKAIQLNPKFKEGYQLLGNIYNGMGDPQTAQQYYNAVNQL